MPEQDISNFFENEYTQYAVYDVARKIANYIDGLKISSRKVVHTILDKNVSKPTKVSRLVSTVAEHTEYIHGEASLCGVMTGLAQEFVGTNNVPLLKREGSFGTRLIPAAAAPRYIQTAKEEYLDLIFSKDDYAVLEHQHFEGEQIEPQFFVPTIPLILVNGSEAISTGFAQKILPRDPVEITRYIKATLNGKNTRPKFLPHYVGWNGTVVKTDTNSYTLKGSWKKTSANTIEITELPPNFTLERYTKHLDSLDEKKIIYDYTDLSNGNEFKFEIKTSRDFLKATKPDRIEQIFKLTQAVTENLTCNDESWRVVNFKDPKEIIDRYIDIKLHYTQKRKEHMLQSMKEQLQEWASKYLFIKGVVEDTIVVNKKKYDQIEAQLDKIDGIKKMDDSYAYLLRMQISSLTKEKYEELQKKIKALKAEWTALNKKSPREIWLEDLEKLEKALVNIGK